MSFDLVVTLNNCFLVIHKVNKCFSLVGLFDWKRDRKFFARFEEPVPPEREFPTEDSESFLPSNSTSACSISLITGTFPPFLLSSHCPSEAGAWC